MSVLLTLDKFVDYVERLDNLVEITPKITIIPDGSGDPYKAVVQTKEVYDFESESARVKKMDELKRDPNFKKMEVKYIAEKVDKKTEEVLADEIFRLIVNMDFTDK
jgi:hypothetical protein